MRSERKLKYVNDKKSPNKKDGSNGDIFLNYLRTGVLLNFLGLALASMIAGYFQVNYFASLFFMQRDGWCNVPGDSIGVHCFGDFNERFAPSISDPVYPPWHDNLELSPISPYFTWFANHILFSLMSQRLCILLVLLLALIGIVIPVYQKIHLIKKNNIVFVWVFIFTSFPVLFALDRLNNIVFAFPFIFLFLYQKLIRGKELEYTWMLIPILCAIKPQFIIFTIVYFLENKIRTGLRAFLLSLFTVFILVIGIDGFNIGRFIEWIRTSLHYGSIAASTGNDFWPSNLSLTSAVRVLLYYPLELVDQIFNLSLLKNVNIFAKLASYLIYFIALFISWKYRKNLSRGSIILITVILFCFVPLNYVAAYYSLPLTVFAVIIILSSSVNDLLTEQVPLRILAIAFTLSSSDVIMPFVTKTIVITNFNGYELWHNSIQLLTPIVWMLVLYFTVLNNRNGDRPNDRIR